MGRFKETAKSIVAENERRSLAHLAKSGLDTSQIEYYAPIRVFAVRSESLVKFYWYKGDDKITRKKAIEIVERNLKSRFD